MQVEVTDKLLFSTELVGLRVLDTRGKKIGNVKDAALVPLIDAGRIDRFLVGGGWSWLSFRYDQVKKISLDGIFLKDEQLTPYHSDEYMLRIVRDLLDQQIIDSHGRKVVRVTDITFQIVPEKDYDYLRIMEVDIGVRSILRRLLQGWMPAKIVRSMQGPIPPNSIAWDHCSVLEADPQRRLRLNISPDKLEAMHPADLADIVEELGPEDREAIIESIDAEVAADTLSEMDPDVQASILESLETEKAAEIIEEMSPDQAADALAELEDETSQEILEEMDPESKTEVSELIEYEEDTAGAMMNTEFISVNENETIKGAVDVLRKNEDLIENLSTIFLVDSKERLVAMVPVARLFLASEDTKLRSLALEMLVKVNAEAKQNRVTELFDKYNLMTLPVVDEEGKIEGVITADDIITVLRQR